MGRIDESQETEELDFDEEEYTDTDVFDPESIANALEQVRPRARKKISASARARIEELIEQKRLERELREFQDEDFEDFDATWVEEQSTQ
jgi:glycosyltransferase involved in cell wall biosynthesis